MYKVTFGHEKDTPYLKTFSIKKKIVAVSNLPRKKLKKLLERNLDIHLWFISGERQF